MLRSVSLRVTLSFGFVPLIVTESSDSQSLQDVTIQAMAQMLHLHKGNVSAAAKALGVSRNTIYRKKNLLPHLLD